MTEYIVTEKDEGVRLDKLLTLKNNNYSRQQIQSWIKNKNVTVNEREEKANYRCKLNDKIKWEIPVEKVMTINPENIPLTILYEDNYLLVINKPKGMLVHPTPTVRTNTLVNGLKYHSAHLSNLSGEERPGIVHRLDKDTSGVLVVAKDNDTHEHLKNQFKNQTVTRIYEAIVFGVIPHEQGIIKAPIGRNPKNRLEMAVVEDGKQAETHFKVLHRFSQYTHIECELKTGRTHQIRVHMKYMNHPIIGDEIYARKKTSLIKGQALFAKQLEFVHPKLEKVMSFTVPQPTQFKNLLIHLAKIT